MKTVIDGGVALYSFLDREKRERVIFTAMLPKDCALDWEGQSLNVIDWKIDPESHTVKLTYQTRQDVCAPILDAVLPLVEVRVPLRPPTKSKNWEITDTEQWRNKKTGERVYI